MVYKQVILYLLITFVSYDCNERKSEIKHNKDIILYTEEQIDIADLSKHPTDGAGNMYAKIGHEVEEQVQKQRYRVSYEDGAHSAGMKVEAKISGVSFRFDSRGIIVNDTRNKQ